MFGRWFEATFGEQPTAIWSAAHLSELEEVMTFVGAGVGLSIIPRDAVEGLRGPGGVEILNPGRGQPCYNQVFLVVRSESSPRPEILQLVGILGESRR